MEADLGAVNAVLSDAVQRRMLGETVDLDFATAGSTKSTAAARDLPKETAVREQVQRLRSTVDETIAELGITPDRIHRVVDTALQLARQQKLKPHIDERDLTPGLFAVPTLTGSWARAA